jgi:hypothetical protein
MIDGVIEVFIFVYIGYISAQMYGETKSVRPIIIGIIISAILALLYWVVIT